MMGLPRFISFSGKPSFEVGDFDLWFDICLVVAWFWRWYLLPIQAVVLLLWLRNREKRLVARWPGCQGRPGGLYENTIALALRLSVATNSKTFNLSFGTMLANGCLCNARLNRSE